MYDDWVSTDLTVKWEDEDYLAPGLQYDKPNTNHSAPVVVNITVLNIFQYKKNIFLLPCSEFILATGNEL
jgi:hypothetical protein